MQTLKILVWALVSAVITFVAFFIGSVISVVSTIAGFIFTVLLAFAGVFVLVVSATQTDTKTTKPPK
jgi:putative Mn2+ efflux pump MntP